MAAVAFLIDAARPDVDLGPAVAERLARLGVTTLALYRDRLTLCLVVEGWSFDASSANDAAVAIGVEGSARLLAPVMQTAIRSTPHDRVAAPTGS